MSQSPVHQASKISIAISRANGLVFICRASLRHGGWVGVVTLGKNREKAHYVGELPRMQRIKAGAHFY